MAAHAFTNAGLGHALAALGDTPEGVAQYLFDAEHLGKPDDDCGCPVAVYLLACFPGTVTSVTEESPVDLVAEVWRGGLEYRSATARLPIAVREFVRRFDAGDFPELDWRNEPVAP